MSTSRPAVRLIAILVSTSAALLISTGVALAHPESEGAHPAGCVVTAEPGTVAPGGQFTVSGNFGRAAIFVLPGANAAPGENAVPNATTPEGNSFSVTFTASMTPGDLTVVAGIPETECGDTDHVTVGAVPNTATETPTMTLAMAGAILLLAAVAIGTRRAAALRR
jgi:hypothetical protein